MTFDARRVEGLSMTVEPDSTKASDFTLTGPKLALDGLSGCSNFETVLSGTLGARDEITLTGEAAVAVGIPAGSTYYAFAYPLSIEGADLQDLISRAIEQEDCGSSPAWLDFVLIGGYAYFDAEMRLTGANALSLRLTGFEAETPFKISLVGPRVTSSRRLEPLRLAGRLQGVTIPQLIELGFHSFGWVNAGERLLGETLKGGAHGCFIYARTNDDYAYYYGLLPEGVPEEAALEELQGTALELDQALKASGVSLRGLAKAAVKDIKELKKEILAGQDGLGAIVKIVSKKHRHIDRFFHFCNGVGLRCADRHRAKLLLINVLIGCCVFACAVCGALGLSFQAIRVLPWGAYYDIPVSVDALLWWGCGNATAPACEPLRGALSDAVAAHPVLRLAQRQQQASGGAFGELTVARGDWLLNQAGFCVHIHSDIAGHRLPYSTIDGLYTEYSPLKVEEWMADEAVANGYFEYNVTAWTGQQEGGFCLRWDLLAAWKHLQATSYTIVGSCVDAWRDVGPFALVMGAFGGFMKIVEPISRMKKSTDMHQKTIVLIILVVTTIVPLLGVLNFGVRCLIPVAGVFNEPYGSEFVFGDGGLLFMLSVLLQIPITIIHVLIPAGAMTAIHKPKTTRLKSQATMGAGAFLSATVAAMMDGIGEAVQLDGAFAPAPSCEIPRDEAATEAALADASTSLRSPVQRSKSGRFGRYSVAARPSDISERSKSGRFGRYSVAANRPSDISETSQPRATAKKKNPRLASVEEGLVPKDEDSGRTMRDNSEIGIIVRDSSRYPDADDGMIELRMDSPRLGSSGAPATATTVRLAASEVEIV